MTSSQRRGPSQVIQARELKPGDVILARGWTVLAIRELDGGQRIQVSATSGPGLIRQATFADDETVEVTR